MTSRVATIAGCINFPYTNPAQGSKQGNTEKKEAANGAASTSNPNCYLPVYGLQTPSCTV
jgi:hypothetical protein